MSACILEDYKSFFKHRYMHKIYLSNILSIYV